MIFLIPARAGSKRLPGKNKRPFCGLPLWEWSLATACRVALPEDIVIVSTDDDEILAYSPYGYGRPAALCRDDTPTQAVVDDLWERFPAHDSLCLLQPTSPTRSDSLVRSLVNWGGQVRSVTNSEPNGQCYIYIRDQYGWMDVETDAGFDIDTLEQFLAAEQDMMRRFQ